MTAPRILVDGELRQLVAYRCSYCGLVFTREQRGRATGRRPGLCSNACRCAAYRDRRRRRTATLT